MQARSRSLQGLGLCSTPSQVLLALMSRTDLLTYRSPAALAAQATFTPRLETACALGAQHFSPAFSNRAARVSRIPRHTSQHSKGRAEVLGHEPRPVEVGSGPEIHIDLPAPAPSSRPPTGAPALARRAALGMARHYYTQAEGAKTRSATTAAAALQHLLRLPHNACYVPLEALAVLAPLLRRVDVRRRLVVW